MIYCYQSTQAKTVHQMSSVLLFHVLLLYNPPMQLHTAVVSIWYLLKACYWKVSASQIHLGYDKTHCREDFWTSTPLEWAGRHWKPSYVKLYGYTVYKAVPFLFELRVLLDWMCTDTALSFLDWFKLEDIHGQLFVNKSNRRFEAEDDRKMGDIQPRWMRLLLGGLIVFGLIILLGGGLFICLLYTSPSPRDS
eukprot:TRINITY_DN31614_c0_g1_i1.p1 TRINITY_DN31614_c0_g1~~TRINITY_DN31614_c0_g1_i1.p1  ORF type:complete len:193 (-),score=43.53 TRINITY_DN31614_c0_g1_i1:86-664(-)